MHVEYFKYFYDFAKTLSISRTASNFYMTPQGISRAIHTLEKEFGVPLVNRLNNNLSLTEAGQILAEDARAISEQYLGAHRHMTSIVVSSKALLESQVSIYVTAFVSAYILPLMNLCSPRLFPFSLSVRESNIYKILPRTREKELPLTFSIISLPEIAKYEEMLEEAISCKDLEYIPLLRIPLEVLVSISSPIANLRKLTVEDLSTYPVIFYNDPALFDAVTSIIGKQNVVITTSSFHMIEQELERNHAITFMPSIAQVRGLPEATILIPLVGAFFTRVGFLGTKEALADSNVNLIINYIRNFFQNSFAQKSFKDCYEILDQ